MSPDTFITHIILSGLSTSVGTAVAIILATFILEDAAMVAVGVMAADGLLSVPLGLGSLATGIALGDFGLYGMGRLATAYPRLGRFVHSERLRPLATWLNVKLYSTVIAARFLPGAWAANSMVTANTKANRLTLIILMFFLRNGLLPLLAPFNPCG